LGGAGMALDWPRFLQASSEKRPAGGSTIGEGTGIVFGAVGNVEREDGALFVIDPLGGAGRQILDEPVGGEMAPAWSPDRTMIAFSMNVTPGEDADTVDTNMEIFVVDADGTDLRRLTHHAGTDSNPSWSPDGTRIAFTRFPDGAVRESDSAVSIWSVTVDGSRLRELTGGPGLVDHPSWSPSGQEIAFHRYVAEDDAYDIFVMDMDGEDVRRLPHTPAGSNTQPAWSPDGSRIAFVNDVDQNRLGGSNLYVADIASTPDVQQVTADTGSLHDPAWSPDGSALALIRTTEGRGRLSPKERIVVVRLGRGPMRSLGGTYEMVNGLDWR
jgi:TolB protein